MSFFNLDSKKKTIGRQFFLRPQGQTLALILRMWVPAAQSLVGWLVGWLDPKRPATSCEVHKLEIAAETLPDSQEKKSNASSHNRQKTVL